MGTVQRSAVVRAVLLTLLSITAVAVGAGAAVLGRAAATPGPVVVAPGPAVAAAAASRPAARPLAPRVAGPCAASRSAKLVEVRIGSQRAWFCDHTRTVRSVPVTTGASALRGRATPTGWFRIEGRARDATLRPEDGGRYHVRYWVPFSGTAYGFHDASWQRFPLGSSAYRAQGSHGCVHLSLAAMRFLYRWGATGTAVHITR